LPPLAVTALAAIQVGVLVLMVPGDILKPKPAAQQSTFTPATALAALLEQGKTAANEAPPPVQPDPPAVPSNGAFARVAPEPVAPPQSMSSAEPPLAEEEGESEADEESDPSGDPLLSASNDPADDNTEDVETDDSAPDVDTADDSASASADPHDPDQFRISVTDVSEAELQALLAEPERSSP